MQYSEKPERTTLFIMDADKNKNIATFLIQKSEDRSSKKFLRT